MPRPEITVGELKSMVEYHEDGSLTWKVQRGRFPPGTKVGTPINSSGRLQTSINGVRVYVSHVVWFFHTGEWPNESLFIDHINRMAWDNRFENLREVTHQKNCCNRDKRTQVHLVWKDGRSFYLGEHLSRDVETVKLGAVAVLQAIEKEHIC